MSIRDDFFANKAVGALWDVAVSIKRGNPLPLDSNSVFASYEALETYVAGPLAYPGQIVAVVEENSTHIYYLNQELGIQAVGGIPAVDDKTIELNKDVLSLYNFEKAFYKFIEETTDEAAGEVVEAHYEKVEVSEVNPWKAGLEPKVVFDNGEYVIGWFESKEDVVEELQTTINELNSKTEALEEAITGDSGLNQQIADIKQDIGTKANAETGVSATGIFAELDKKADANSVYTKTETDSLIANAAHLKRKIFNTKEEAQFFVDTNSTTADQYIYMIPSGLQLDSNRYYEYMVVEGVLEQVGNWEVNLDDYFTEDELKTYLNDYYTETEVNTILAAYAKSSDLEGYYTSKQVDSLLSNQFSKEEINNLLNSYVAKEEGKRLITEVEIAKLDSIQANAEVNFIKSVSSDFNVSDIGNLTLVGISTQQVTGLNDLLNSKVNKVSSLYEGKETEWILLSPENQAKLNALVVGEEGVEISGKVNASNVEELGSWLTNNRDTVAGLFSTVDSNKLSGIEEGAQVNFIKAVNTAQMSVDENGVLTIINAPSEHIINGVSNDFVINENKILELSKTYLEESVYKTEVGDLSLLIHASGVEDSTLVDEVNYINEKLKWQEL